MRARTRSVFHQEPTDQQCDIVVEVLQDVDHHRGAEHAGHFALDGVIRQGVVGLHLDAVVPVEAATKVTEQTIGDVGSGDSMTSTESLGQVRSPLPVPTSKMRPEK